MTVSLIRSAPSHAGSTGSQSETSYSFTVGQSGDAPKGIVVFTFVDRADEIQSGVTYGGEALSTIDGGMAVDTVGELGRVQAWALLSGVPSGSQDVVVSRTNTTNICWAVAFLLGGSADLKVAGSPVLQQESATMTAVTIDDGLTSGASIVLAMGYSGDNYPAVAASDGMTLAAGLSGTYIYAVGAAYETTPTYGSRSRGVTAGNDDRAQVVLAITEDVVASSFVFAPDYQGGLNCDLTGGF